MSSELLEWVYAYLEQDEDIVVPIRKMWNEWHALHLEPSLQVFTATVLADDRIEEMGGADHTDDVEDLSPEETEAHIRDLEAQGFFSGPRVKLKSRELTKEHVARMISMYSDRMLAALEAARESMPDDVDETEEGTLIHVIELAKQLREHLRAAGLESDGESET